MIRSRLFISSAVAAVVVLAWLDSRDAPLRAGLVTDALHHMAAVRELAKGDFPPRHNLVVQDGLPQGHYGPYLVLLGALARWTEASPRAILHCAGLVNLLAFVWVFGLVATQLLGENTGRWAAPAGLLLWGPWPGREVAWPSWQWPGTTSLADAQNFFYPQQAGIVLLLLLLAVLVRPEPLSARGGAPWGRMALSVVLAATLIATHPLTAIALLPALAALIVAGLLRRETAGAARLTFLVALPLLGLALASLWPWYPVLGLLKAASHPGLREPMTSPAATGFAHVATSAAIESLPVLTILGPAVTGVVAAAGLARRGRPFLLLWFLGDLALAFCPWLPLRQRFVLFAALPAQLAATWLLEEAFRRNRLTRALAAALLAAGALSAGERIRWLLGQEVPDLGFMARLTPQSAIVLSDPVTSNGVAGLAGRKVVAPQHPDIFLVAAGGWQRVVDVRTFLDPRTDASARQAILVRWHATHVLIDRITVPDLPPLPYPVLYEGGGYVLYEVRGFSLPPRSGRESSSGAPR